MFTAPTGAGFPETACTQAYQSTGNVFVTTATPDSLALNKSTIKGEDGGDRARPISRDINTKTGKNAEG